MSKLTQKPSDYSISNEEPYLLPAASVGCVYYLYHRNKTDALSVLMCGYAISSFKHSAIDQNTLFGFAPPTNVKLQVMIASLCYSSSLGLLLHLLDANELKNISNGPIIACCCISAACLKLFISGIINGYNSNNPKSQIRFDSGFCLSVCLGAVIGAFLGHKFNETC
eukprot:69773_1